MPTRESDPRDPATEESAEYAAALEADAARAAAELAPVLVRLAEPIALPSCETSDSFEPDRIPVDDSIDRVVERQADRMRVTIVNVGATECRIFSRKEAAYGMGFPLAAGASVSILTRAAVYAGCDVGGSTTVAVLAEFKRPKADGVS